MVGDSPGEPFEVVEVLQLSIDLGLANLFVVVCERVPKPSHIDHPVDEFVREDTRVTERYQPRLMALRPFVRCHTDQRFIVTRT